MKISSYSEVLRRYNFVILFSAVFTAAAICPLQSVLPDQKRAKLKTADSLNELLIESRSKKIPIMIMFSEMGCPYCGEIENDFLNPMILSGMYTSKVIIRKITYDNNKTIKDLEGKPVKISVVTEKYNIRFYPTIIFLNSNGTEIAERIVGLSTPDFFGYILDEAIDKAVKANKQKI